MGDRCYLQATIHGHVETLDILEEVIEALESENLEPVDEYGVHVSNDSGRGKYMSSFANSLAFEKSPVFADDEHNYADVSALESVLTENKIAYAVSHGAGDEYGGGMRAFIPLDGTFNVSLTHDGDPVISVDAIRKALSQPDPLAEMTSLLHEADMAQGKNLPRFSVGEELKRHLATMLGVAVLSPETV